MADTNATERQLMAIHSWENPKQAGHYTKKANRKELGSEGMQQIVPEQKSDESGPLSEGFPQRAN